MAGWRVDTIPPLPLYSSQVSRGSLVGITRSASAVVSSIKLEKLTTKRRFCFSASVTVGSHGIEKTGLVLLSSKRSTGSRFKRSKKARTRDRRAAVSTRCRPSKSKSVSWGSNIKFSRFAAMFAWRALSQAVPGPIIRGFSAVSRRVAVRSKFSAEMPEARTTASLLKGDDTCLRVETRDSGRFFPRPDLMAWWTRPIATWASVPGLQESHRSALAPVKDRYPLT